MTRRDMIWFSLCVALVAGNLFWVSEIIRQGVRAELRSLSTAARNSGRSGESGTPCGTNLDSALLSAQVRQAVGAALADSDHHLGEPQALISDEEHPDEPELERPAPSDAAIIAYDRSHEIIEASLTRGTWTREDSLQIRQYTHKLDDDLRGELMLRLMDANNEGKLEIDSPFGTPF